MTDAEHAARLRSALDAMPAIPPNSTLAAAIERAITLLEREAVPPRDRDAAYWAKHGLIVTVRDNPL